MRRLLRRQPRNDRRTVVAAVECLEARQLLATFTVTSLADSGIGSFRQAILDANANAGSDQIVFNNPGADYPIFQPLSPLPKMTDPVVLDATSEPGFVNRPIVTLDGSKAGPDASGLVLLGGQSVVEGFVITGFSNYGIVIAQGGGDLVSGNYLGVNATGQTAAPNGSGGLMISGASNNSIGLPVQGGGNVISGNGGDGVQIVGPVRGALTPVASGNQVLSNFIGLDSTGTQSLGNRGNGIQLVNASANAIGGTGFGFGNVISSNGGSGIAILGDSSATPSSSSGGFNRVQGNLIGAARDATNDFGNGGSGVFVSASANSIGGTVSGAANLIAHNGTNGVTVLGQNVPVLSNAIFGNHNLGIDLVPSDASTRVSSQLIGNNGQKAPAILSLRRNGAAATITGSLVAAPSTTYTLQFFGNLAGEAQGRVFVGSSFQTTDATGQISFALIIPTGVPSNGLVTATATSPTGGTSAFSQPSLTAPTVGNVFLSPDRTHLTISFTDQMDPASAMSIPSYRVSAPGNIPIRSIAVSSDRRSIQLTLKKTIPVGTFAHMTIHPPGSPVLINTTGVELDGDNNGQPGGTFSCTVAIGTKLTYTDAAGHRVTLQLAKGGSVEVYRASNGNAEIVRLFSVHPGKSVLSGTVKGKNARTSIPILTGLAGAINKLTNPPFVIGATG